MVLPSLDGRSGTMKPGPRASPVIKIASVACDARPNEQRTGDPYLVGRLRTFAGEVCPERAAAAASAR
jgi:hypothetical protein